MPIVTLVGCAIPNAAGIRSALDDGEHDGAVDLALADQRSLDLLASEILERGARDEKTRDDALGAIRQTGSRANKLLGKLAASDDAILSITAKSMLYRRGDRAYQEDLIEALESEYALVRAAAVQALVSIDQSPNFHERYILDNEPTARLAVVQYLATHDVPWAQSLLVDVARKDPDPTVRTTAVSGLDPSEETSRDILREALDDSDRAIRCAAASALGSETDSAQLTWTAHLLIAPVTEEGIRFATALLRADDEYQKAADYLAAGLADESPKVRLLTLVALTGIATEIDGFDALSSDPSAQVRVAWCRLSRKLGTSKPAERIEILEAIVDQKSDAPPLDAWLALAEEKGQYAKIRAKVWHLLTTGKPASQRYIIVHAVRPFDDTPIAIRGMTLDDPTVRFQAAATWLTR
jgi:HEAT repeat protein